MKGKFYGIAEDLARILAQKERMQKEISRKNDHDFPLRETDNSNKQKLNGQVSIDDIIDVFRNSHGPNINCYPGHKSNNCFETALFFALQGFYTKKGNYNIGTILRKFVEHFNGKCKNVTTEAAIFTNAWWPQELDYYFNEIQKIKRRNVYLEAYFIGPCVSGNCRPSQRILMLNI